MGGFSFDVNLTVVRKKQGNGVHYLRILIHYLTEKKDVMLLNYKTMVSFLKKNLKNFSLCFLNFSRLWNYL